MLKFLSNLLGNYKYIAEFDAAAARTGIAAKRESGKLSTQDADMLLNYIATGEPDAVSNRQDLLDELEDYTEDVNWVE